MGFELVHPRVALQLMKYEKHHVFCVALLSWCIEKAQQEFAEELEGHELSVIKITLHGDSYPAIGLRCDEVDPAIERLAEWLEREMDSRLPSYSVADLIEFVGDAKKDWPALTADIMSRPS